MTRQGLSDLGREERFVHVPMSSDQYAVLQRKAARVVRAHARDDQDLEQLLDVLGIEAS